MLRYFLTVPIIVIFFITGCSHRFEGVNSSHNYGDSYSSNVIYYKDMRLDKVEFNSIDGWSSDEKKGSFEAYMRGCSKRRKGINLKSICEKGKTLYKSNPDNRNITYFFEKNFTPYKVNDRNKDSSIGLITGYYVPFLNGSLIKTRQFKYPIYAKPRDFRLPYLTHREIDSRDIDAEVICWVDDRVDRFFLHIQGSGTVKLRDGSVIGVGYTEKNGYRYRSIGTYIHRQFGVSLHKLSAGYIKKWLKSHPKKRDEVLFYNESFVFFKKQGKNSAIGAMGTNLVSKSTIAIDTTHIPLGSPIYIKSENNRDDPVLNHLFMAQDRGGAIKGVIRADLFFGFGNEAGKGAGTMKRKGEFYILVPKGYRF